MARKSENVAAQCERIISDVKKGVFQPVYLLMGEEAYYPELVCDAIIDSCIPPEDKDFNETVCYGTDTDAEQVISCARRYPMMSDRQLVVLKEAQAMSRLESLSVYCKDPLETTVLVILLHGAKVDRRSALCKAVEEKGTVVDSLSSSGLPAANAVLLNKDSSFVNGLPTDSAGHFKLSLPGRGAYILRITMTGYKTKYIDITKGQRKQTLELGTISLPLSYVLLKGAEVKGSLSEVEANEDTISFNAEAFNVQEGEALEELIKLLPGVEVDGNTITYNGKEVTEFRVNGKDFFKGNKSVAMRNIPVDLVKRIKTYEKKSDYAEQTGIDDGNEQTVMDIVLKQELNETWIANLDGAAGSEGRYINKLFANRITDLSRLTVTGNLRNEDARSTNKQLGFDFNINNGRKKNEAGRFELGGNAGINNNRSHGESWRNAENFISSGSTSSFSNNNSYNKNRSTSANANLRLEWQPDTMTTITANKRFSIGRSNAYSRTRSATFSGDPYEIVQDGDPLDEIFDEKFSQETMPEFYPIAVNRDSRESKSRRRNFSYGSC